MKRILIVDDQAGWRKFHVEAIKKILGENAKIDCKNWAKDAYNTILENAKNPYDIIITDMQMETDYVPLMAGEWLIEQVKSLPNYYKTKIIVISASPKIRLIAENYSVDYIPKSTAMVSIEPYRELISE